MKKITMKILASVFALVVVGGAAVGILYLGSNISTGGSFETVYFDDVEVLIGRSTPDDLAEGGFTKYGATLESGYWERVGVTKDHDYYGKIHIKNESQWEKKYDKCTIFGVEIDYTERADGEITLSDEYPDYSDCSMAEVKELMTDYDLSLETESLLIYEINRYEFRFSFEDDLIKSLKITDGTDASYGFE